MFLALVSSKNDFFKLKVEGRLLLVEQLPKSFELRYGAIPEKIFIRQCYLDLYERAAGLMFSGKMKKGVALFTGVPGIGKSLFLIYFLYRYLHDDRFPDKRFALEFDREKYSYFEAVDPAKAEDFACFELSNKEILLEVLVLADIAAPVEPAWRAKHVFIFSSPNPLRYKEMMKIEPRYRFTMPTWSKEELEAVNSNTESWSEEFDICGGVPRLVFASEPKTRPAIVAALQVKGALIAESFFKDGLGTIDLLQNFMLVHINPPKHADGHLIYDGSEDYSLASSYVYDELMRLHIHQMIAEACNLFNSGTGPKTYGNAYSGSIFEKLCLYFQPITGLSFNATSLSLGASSRSFALPSETLILEIGWDGLKELPINTLLIPHVSNLESADAFYVVEDSPNSYQLVILQFTVAESHPMKVNGLVKIMNAFPEPVLKNINGLKIVFITPAKGKCLGKKQNLVTSEGKIYSTEKMPDVVKDSQQFLYKHRF